MTQDIKEKMLLLAQTLVKTESAKHVLYVEALQAKSYDGPFDTVALSKRVILVQKIANEATDELMKVSTDLLQLLIAEAAK